MILPCGRSAHLEGGYAVGKGKALYILGHFPKGEFDVMYGFATALVPWHSFTGKLKRVLEAKLDEELDAETECYD